MVTPDMDSTVRFYHGVLGMRIVATLSAGPMRHYFFEIGPQNTLAFFGWDDTPVDTESLSKPAGIPPSLPAQFDHLSFNLPDEQALVELQARLRAHEVEVTDLVDHGFLRSIYFTDPNGIALEASWWVDRPDRPGRLLRRDRRVVHRHRSGSRGARAGRHRRAGLDADDPARRRRRRSGLTHPAPEGADGEGRSGDHPLLEAGDAPPARKPMNADHHRIDGEQAHVRLRRSARRGSPR